MRVILAAAFLLITGCGEKQDPLAAGEEVISCMTVNLSPEQARMLLWSVTRMVFEDPSAADEERVRDAFRSGCVETIGPDYGMTADVCFVKD